MLSIGITGSIGSGKTTVCKIFESNWNIPVYYADERAKWFMQYDAETKQQAIRLFGQNAYLNHQLNKALIAQKIFSNTTLKIEWEKYIHTKVINDYIYWKEKQTSYYHLHEAALIFETNLTHLFDYIILVTAPFELKIKRLEAKGMSRKEAITRMQHQLSDDKKQANFRLINDEQQSLLEQIINIHQTLML